MKLISILTPTYNEEENVEELIRQVRAVFAGLPQYDYEHLFIDNASTDKTVEILKRCAAEDKHIRIIVNVRNFGHVRSPYHGLLQTRGDAVVPLVADLQDPPQMIPDFLKKWEEGYKVVMAVKAKSEESAVFFAVRRLYYALVKRVADVELVENFYGFGLVDKRVVEIMRGIDDPYPYYRGLLSEIGFPAARIDYTQRSRKRGFTKNNFYTLYDLAMLGFTNHSKVPLRLATLAGFALSMLSFLIAVAYLVYKLVFWEKFSLGMAPLVVGLFFFSSIQLFFIGLLGEYVGAIQTKVMRRPLVIEKERVNF